MTINEELQRQQLREFWDRLSIFPEPEKDEGEMSKTLERRLQATSHNAAGFHDLQRDLLNPEPRTPNPHEDPERWDGMS